MRSCRYSEELTANSPRGRLARYRSSVSDLVRSCAANGTAQQHSHWMECGLTMALPSQDPGKSEPLFSEKLERVAQIFMICSVFRLHSCSCNPQFPRGVNEPSSSYNTHVLLRNLSGWQTGNHQSFQNERTNNEHINLNVVLSSQ